ncbi:hypothetical protein PLCT1_01609 [Planctomycetaceae bacterium]|nr:hypothetical protein PLCT1_01609 [Planctomycetaceae bacterium]
MTDNKIAIWLSLLTGAVAVLVIGVIVGLAAISSDVAQLDEQLTALKFGAPAESAIDQLSPLTPSAALRNSLKLTPDAPASSTGAAPGNFKAQIDELQTISNTLRVGLTVQFSGPADLLYQPPVVVDAQGTTYRVTPASLKAARFALLDLTTAGQAAAAFVFEPAPPAQGALTFTFNPGMPVGDVVAPRIEVVLRKE